MFKKRQTLLVLVSVIVIVMAVGVMASESESSSTKSVRPFDHPYTHLCDYPVTPEKISRQGADCADDMTKLSFAVAPVTIITQPCCIEWEEWESDDVLETAYGEELIAEEASKRITIHRA